MRTRLFQQLLPTLLLVVFAGLAIGSARQMSCTYDEPCHLMSGYAALRFRDFRFGPNHPPLIRAWSALPNVLDPDTRFSTTEESYQSGKQLDTAYSFLAVQNSPEALLFRSRLMIVLLSTGLGLLTYLWARRVSGFCAAIASLFLFALEPNLMAHGSLVTTDMGLTFFFTLSSCFLWLLWRRLSWPRVLGFALFFGLAQVSKFSALVLWMAAGTVLVLRVLSSECWETGTSHAPLTSRKAKATAAAGIMLLLIFCFLAIVWGVYGLRYEMAPAPSMTFDVTQDKELRISNEAMGAQLSSIRILPEGYVRGVAQLLTWPKRPIYFGGRILDEARWYFYPTVLLLKLPTAVLILLVQGGVLLVRRRVALPVGWPALVLPPLTLLLAGMASGANTGIRHLLPILPSLLIAAGAAAATLLRDSRGKIVAIALALLTLVEFSVSYPDVIAAFNLPSGGPSRGMEYLADSNLDWGQGLLQVRDYLEREGLDAVKLEYFGFLLPEDYGIWVKPIYEDEVLLPKKDLYLISITHAQGVYLPGGEGLRWVRHVKPTGRIGRSILIYDLR